MEKDFLSDNTRQIDDHLILKAYYRRISSLNTICEPDLLRNLLVRVLITDEEGGSVLIFVPNYQEMSHLYSSLNTETYFSLNKIRICMVHEEMNIRELEAIYESQDRKIVILNLQIFSNHLKKN